MLQRPHKYRFYASLAGGVIFVLLSLNLCAQENGSNKKFQAGVRLGLVTSQMTGDGYSGFFKFGPTGGFFARTPMSDKWAFQYELIYIQKGSRKPAQPDKGIYDSYKIRLHYVQVPLMFQYGFNEKLQLEFGPALGVFAGSKEWDQTGERNKDQSPYSWRPLEIDAILGLNYYFKPDKFFVNFRAQHSIFSIVHTTAVTVYGIYGGAWNIVLGLNLGYRF